MLLVVTNRADLTCDWLIVRLRERGVPHHRLNTERYGVDFTLDIAIGSSVDVTLRLANGATIAASEVTGVYFRQPRSPEPPADIVPADAAFVRREAQEALRSLWRVLPAQLWLNHPRALWLASNKVEQLALAGGLGLVVPDTLVSSDADAIRRFSHDHEGRIVCKAVKHGFSHDDGVVTLAVTKRVGRDFLTKFSDYAQAPAIYQREIEKTYDIRVTVIDELVFATAIHSQAYVETEVDWRTWDADRFELRHETVSLPEDVEAGCIGLMRRFGLRYAAIDLVLGRDGQTYFLELNPNGQWAWIEQMTGAPIRDTIIDAVSSSGTVHERQR